MAAFAAVATAMHRLPHSPFFLFGGGGGRNETLNGAVDLRRKGWVLRAFSVVSRRDAASTWGNRRCPGPKSGNACVNATVEMNRQF